MPPRSSRYFIDANVFLYAAGEESPLKTRALSVLGRLAAEDAVAVSNCLVLEEVHYVHYRQTRKAGESLALLRDIRAGLGEVFPITQETVSLAWDLFAKSPSPVTSVKDYYHAASMLQHGIADIVTFDRDYERFPFVQRHT